MRSTILTAAALAAMGGVAWGETASTPLTEMHVVGGYWFDATSSSAVILPSTCSTVVQTVRTIACPALAPSDQEQARSRYWQLIVASEMRNAHPDDRPLDDLARDKEREWNAFLDATERTYGGAPCDLPP